mgnify:CR=1 FL=1
MLFVSLFHYSYTIAVAGSTGGLGSELVFQTLFERKTNVIGISRKNRNVHHPFRDGGINKDSTFIKKEIIHPNLRNILISDSDVDNLTYDALFLCMTAEPFQDDNCYLTTAKLCSNLPERCKSICLISYYGVQNYNPVNVGKYGMNNWYLKSTSDSKQLEEVIVTKCANLKKINYMITRPNVLSYGKTLIPSIARETLARDILNWTFEILDES